MARARFAGAPSPASGRRREPGTAGFLLTETLATFTISAFVLLGLVSAASVLLRAVDGSVARIEHVDDLGRAMETIRQDVAAISRARWNGTEPQAFVFRGTPNSLFFAQLVPSAGGGRTGVAVALREILVDGRPTLTRSTARLGARAAAFGDLTFGPQREIWTGVARLRFSYLPQRDGGSEPMTRTNWPVGTKLPTAILIEAIDRETRRVLVATRVSLESNADVGCLDADEASSTAEAAAQSGQPDPATQGAGGLPTGDMPKPELLPAVTSSSTPAQTAANEPFCSLSRDAGDKDAKPAPAARPAGAPL